LGLAVSTHIQAIRKPLAMLTSNAKVNAGRSRAKAIDLDINEAFGASEIKEIWVKNDFIAPTYLVSDGESGGSMFSR
jgi:hypothetical protein